METAGLAQHRRQPIHQALPQLPAKERDIIQLCYFEVLSREEAAEVLGSNTNNVYIRLHKEIPYVPIDYP